MLAAKIRCFLQHSNLKFFVAQLGEHNKLNASFWKTCK